MVQANASPDNQPVVKVDLDLMKEHGHDMSTMLVVAEPGKEPIEFDGPSSVKTGDVIVHTA